MGRLGAAQSPRGSALANFLLVASCLAEVGAPASRTHDLAGRPSRAQRYLFMAACHNLTVLSKLADARLVPSGENATEVIISV